jgi:putative ATP-dependent endonuclease of the OLD family
MAYRSELAKTLDIDLSGANVGFVQMGGVRNFANFAAQATIDLLARRRIRLWFLADRDERADAEVDEMVRRLGAGAVLTVLDRRELENYLLDSVAVTRFIAEKRAAAGLAEAPPTSDEVASATSAQALALKDEVVRLRYHAAALKPVFLQGRRAQGEPQERLERASEELTQRLRDLAELQRRIATDVEADWDRVAVDRAPGAAILDGVARQFGVRFVKENGDSARLARFLDRDAIPQELRRLLREIVG